MTYTTYEVVIPARNAGTTLALTLASLGQQTCLPSKITVIDDGSSDGTAAIAREAGADCVTTQGIGLAQAQNLALPMIRAPYVAMVDADDAWMSETGRTLVGFLEGHTQFGAVTGTAATFTVDDPAGEVLRRCASPVTEPDFNPKFREVGCGELWRTNVATKSATMFRSDALASIFGYRPLPSAEDYDVLLRMLAGGWRVGLTDELTCWRLTSERSMTAKSTPMLAGELEAVRSFHASAYRRAELPHANLRQREMRAWFRALARDVRYHGSLAGSPPPPFTAPVARVVASLLGGSLGRAAARSWAGYIRVRDGRRELPSGKSGSEEARRARG